MLLARIFPELHTLIEGLLRQDPATVARETWIAKQRESFHRNLAAAATAAAASGTAAAAGFVPQTPDPQLASELGDAAAVHARVTQLFALAGVAPPPLADFADAQPAPTPGYAAVLAPHGLGVAAWERLFSGLRAQDVHCPELALSSEVHACFGALDVAPDNGSAVIATAYSDSSLAFGTQAAALVWTLRQLPDAAQPPLIGRPHRASTHPTLPEMLTLQLLRYTEGLPLIDATRFTWLAGTLPDAAYAARHTYDASSNTLRISTRNFADQGPHIGCRPPLSVSTIAETNAPANSVDASALESLPARAETPDGEGAQNAA